MVNMAHRVCILYWHELNPNKTIKPNKESAVEFEQVVMGRQSVRGYKKDPVPKEVIADIINVAKRAPSSMNTQPWHIHALTGAALDEVRSRNMTEMSAGAKPKRDIPSPWSLRGQASFSPSRNREKTFCRHGHRSRGCRAPSGLGATRLSAI